MVCANVFGGRALSIGALFGCVAGKIDGDPWFPWWCNSSSTRETHLFPPGHLWPSGYEVKLLSETASSRPSAGSSAAAADATEAETAVSRAPLPADARHSLS